MYDFLFENFRGNAIQKSRLMKSASKYPAPTSFANVHLTMVINCGGIGSSGDLFLDGLSAKYV